MMGPIRPASAYSRTKSGKSKGKLLSYIDLLAKWGVKFVYIGSRQANARNMATLQTSVVQFRSDFENARRMETPRDTRFRYGYICRLIDDAELAGLPSELRSRTRSVHKAAYWKSVSLLRRDAEHVLKLRREKMAAKQAWDFQSLVGDYARVQLMVVKLTAAGVGHSVRLGVGLDAARAACREFEAPPTCPSSLRAATA